MPSIATLDRPAFAFEKSFLQGRIHNSRMIMKTAQLTEELFLLGILLRTSGYNFAPRSVAEIKRTLRDQAGAAPVEEELFGWGRAVAKERVSTSLLQAMEAAGIAQAAGDGFICSNIKAARLEGNLLWHNAGPAAPVDAVFLGPDTVRYIAALEGLLPQGTGPAPASAIEIGCGSGAAAIWLAQRYPTTPVIATDINPAALWLSEINARLASVSNLAVQRSDVLIQVDGQFDLIICNPPFVADLHARTYRHGGSHFGLELPARIVREGVQRLNKGGRLLMYTASPMVNGRHLISDLLSGVRHQVTVIGTGQFDDLLDSELYQGIDEITTVILEC
jgi:methylase of polypeptide subunit release factors